MFSFARQDGAVSVLPLEKNGENFIKVYFEEPLNKPFPLNLFGHKRFRVVSYEFADRLSIQGPATIVGYSMPPHETIERPSYGKLHLMDCDVLEIRA